MNRTDLQCANLTASIDATDGLLRLSRDGQKLPWTWNVTRATTGTAVEHPAQIRVRTAAGTEQTAPIDLSRLAMRRLSPTHVQWLGETAGAGIALDIELTGEGLVFSISPTFSGTADVVEADWPGQLRFAAAQREVVWSNYCQGALFRPDGKPWTGQTDWPRAACRFYGFTAGTDTLAAIVDDPYDVENYFSDDGVGEMKARIQWQPSMGKLAYRRTVRYLPLEETGYVAVANAFRAYAQRHGLWMSWAERRAANPNLARMEGAFMACAGYWNDKDADQVSAMREMKKLGFNRGYLFSPKLFMFGEGGGSHLDLENNRMSDSQIRQVQDLGYVCAPFLQVEIADERLGLDKFSVDATGQRIVRWQIGERKYYEIAKWRIEPMLPVFDDQLQENLGIHFDTLTAMPYEANHGERPYDRRGDLAFRQEVANYYRRRGKIIVSESMRDIGTMVCDVGTAKHFAPVMLDRRVWAVPLTDLVYHDSWIRTNWEHAAYDDPNNVHSDQEREVHPWGAVLNDLLTASPPILFPEGTMYSYRDGKAAGPDGKLVTTIDWDKPFVYRHRFGDPLTQAVLPSALMVCKVCERHGTERMRSHRFLEANSCLVQESEFESGLHVVVNYSNESYTLPNGKTVAARSSLVEE